ncbi:hypothetical protein K501DRAFT_179295, partial [Backusella circina FSU 941]
KKWVLPSGYNFSEAFIKRRNTLVDECGNCEKTLKADEELAINGIVLLDSGTTSTIINDDNYYNEVCDELREVYSKYKTELDTSIIHQTSSFFATFINNSTLPSYMKPILYSLHRTYYNGYSPEDVNESSIVKDCILPFLDNYFPNNKKYKTFRADKAIGETRKRFYDIDSSLNDHVRKADFSIVSTLSSHLVYALESKSESCKNKSKGDLIKLARYMKDVLDSTESEGFQKIRMIHFFWYNLSADLVRVSLSEKKNVAG